MDNHFQHDMSWHPVMDDFTPSAIVDQDVLWDIDQKEIGGQAYFTLHKAPKQPLYR